MKIKRFSYHNHTDYSNLRLLDSTNKVKPLVERAIELELAGIGITEHESLGSSVELDMLQDEYKEKYPDFKIVRGNEIYLTDTRDTGQYYYHHILLALDAVGNKMLRQLSSQAWLSSYYDRGVERVPTLKSEVEDVIKKYGKGHIYASTACLGSEIDRAILDMDAAERAGDSAKRHDAFDRITMFIYWCLNTYGEDNFCLEVQPSRSKEQLIVNNRMRKIASAYNLPICVTDDAHYLRKEDRFVHKAFLNSKQGEREVDEFYKYTYLQSQDEIISNLEGTGLDYKQLCENSMKILDRCEYYTLSKPQHVIEVPVKCYPVEDEHTHTYDTKEYPTLDMCMHSDNPQERYWVHECQSKLTEIGLGNDKTYLDRLEKEADIMSYVGNRLGTCIFAYPIFLQHYMDIIWDCGSPVGCGRGCFTPGTNRVLLSDGTQKPIDEISIGDSVFTKDGKAHNVINKMSYDCNEVVYDITVANGTFDTITCTNNHKILAQKNKPCPYDREYCIATCKRPSCKHKMHFQEEWIRADKLKIGDYVFFPKASLPEKKTHYIDMANYVDNKDTYIIAKDFISPKSNKSMKVKRLIKIDKDFLYVLGVIIGDGWCRTNDSHGGGQVGIAFNSETKKDISSMNKCIAYFKSIGLSYGICKHRTKNLNQLYVYNRPFALLVQSLVGIGAENKRIPQIALYDNKEEMLSLLLGLLASDGSYDSKSLRFSYDSINYNLISQVKLLCSYLNLYGTITRRSAHGQNKTSYKFRVSGPQLLQYKQVLPLKYDSKTNIQKSIMISDNGCWVKISNISTHVYVGKVYDLTVEGQHNYIVNNIVVHNSAGAGLNHYLLGLTQVNPITHGFMYERFLNKDRVELPDIDIDISPSLRPKIFERIREERGPLGLVQICTYGTVSTKACVKMAARGYRSKEYPDGIPLDEAEYMSSLIDSERGFLWSLSDCFNGNAEKHRKPNKQFILEVSKYEGLKEIMLGIEGLISQRGVHASGVNFYGDDPYETACFMKAKDGSITTQWSLHQQELARMQCS